MTHMNWKASSDRRQQPTPKPRGPKLAEPVTVESLWINRAHDACVLTLSTWKNHNLIDIRKHTMDGKGHLVPTPKGITLKITRLPDLAKAIEKALRRARELGLLAGEGETS
jgi:hypothetical protein